MDNHQENENEVEGGENGEEEYKIEGEEGDENIEQENGDEEEHAQGEEQIEKNDDESLNDLQPEEPNAVHFNIEEYFPFEHKHDQYSCSCCEHYYIDCIQKNVELPEAKCEVCGNEINQRSLQFYSVKNKSKSNKKVVKK